MVGRMGGGRGGGSPCPSPAPFTPTLSGTWKCKPHLPLPPFSGWGAEGADLGGAGELQLGCQAWGAVARRAVSAQEMLRAQPCRLCFAALSSASSHRAVWFSVSLLSFPSPHSLASLVGSLVPVLLPSSPLGVRGWFPHGLC